LLGSIAHASEVSLLMLVPAALPTAQFECAKEILRYLIWRGMSRLTDIELDIMIGVQLVGN
jgi:hypothetical protein